MTPVSTRAIERGASAGGERLRICLVTETMATGVGRHVTDVAKAMARAGHEVHLLHSTGRLETRLLDELAPLAGVTRRAFPMRREAHWTDPAVLAALLRHVRRWGPFDVIHGHSSKGGVYARLLGLLAPGRCFHTPHALVTLKPDLSPLRRALYGTIERGLALATDGVICISDDEMRHAIGLGIDPERLRVIPNGVDPFDTSLADDLRERLGLAPDTVIIGFVGRMDDQKAPGRLVEAAVDILARRQDVHVVMIGEGPLRAGLEAVTRHRGIADRFSWCGDVPARAWLPGFDVLAMPSLYEGFSYVLLEALHAGVPVVSTPVGGIRDAITDGVQGFVVAHDDPQALAERLARLAGDRRLREEMGKRARERATALSVDRMVARLVALYEAPRRPRVAGSAEPSEA